MDGSMKCPKCGAEMAEHPLIAADGTPLGFADAGTTGALISAVCPSCGYAELRAGEAAVPEFSSKGAADFARAVDAGSVGTPQQAEQLRDLIAAQGRAPSAEPLDPGVGSLIALALSAAFMVAGIVWIFMASGPVMEVGGFVARGGPYVVAHPAEDWIWLPTMGATLMVFALFANAVVASRLNRPNLLLVFWTALFGLLSVPFFRYGFNAPGGGLSWAWIVCGFLFALFALPTFLILLMPSSWRGFEGSFGWASLIGAIGGLAGSLWLWNLVA